MVLSYTIIILFSIAKVQKSGNLTTLHPYLFMKINGTGRMVSSGPVNKARFIQKECYHGAKS